MKIVTKVKGIDDFGKERVRGNLFQYSHHYPRVNDGDFLIYFYPEDKAIGIYQAKEETEYYSKDGFQYCSGKMHRYEKDPMDFIEWIKSTNVALALEFENTMNGLIAKHPKT